MHIDQLTLKNFRNFESVDIPLNSKMNIVIGNNGTGKSSLLMGALTAASAFFLGIDYASPRSIKTDDVRHVAHEVKKVYQQVAVYPVEVSCEGVVNEVTCKWSRSLSGSKSNTTYGGASDLRNIASSLQKSASNEYSEDVLPLIAYYGTGRLWAQKQAKKKGKQKLTPCLELSDSHHSSRTWDEVRVHQNDSYIRQQSSYSADDIQPLLSAFHRDQSNPQSTVPVLAEPQSSAG